MRYSLPNSSVTFEIPDSWLERTGAQAFTPAGEHYTHSEASALISLCDIEPPLRANGVPIFDETRAIEIIKGILDGSKLPPIGLLTTPRAPSGRYLVYDGCHRFYLSTALKFSTIPVYWATLVE